MSRQAKDAALLVVLCALGVAGNLFGYPIFYSIEFIFGSIFSLLAVQLLGPTPGLIATFIVALVTYGKWNHPYAAMILILEAIVLVGFAGRRRSNFIIVDALFWLFVGMPLVYGFYYGVMDLAPANVKITMLKQGVNGLFNAMIARVVYMILGSGGEKRQFPMREVLFLSLFMFVLVPSLYLIAVQSHQEQQSTDREIRENLDETSLRVKAVFENWLGNHVESIMHLEAEASSGDFKQLQWKLDQIRGAEKAFKYIGFFDKDATAVAFSPDVDATGRKTLSINYGDRPYLGMLKSELKPMVSELVMSRVGNPRPITMILVPFLDKGKWNGYLAGILDIAVMDEVVGIGAKSATLPGLTYALLDKNERVITSNRKNLKLMTQFLRPDGVLQPFGNGLYQWQPMVAKNISISDKWRTATYVKEVAVGPYGQWKLILEAPIEPFQKKMYESYFGVLLRLCLILGISLIAAFYIAKISITSLRKLEAMTSELPRRLADGAEIEKGESVIFEVSRLMRNYRLMASALKEKFAEIQKLNESLESRILKRTSELATLNRQQDTILRTALFGIAHLKDGKIVWANPAHYRIFGLCPGDVEQRGRAIGDSFSADYDLLERENRATLRSGAAFQAELELRRHGGEELRVIVSGSYIYPDRVEEGSIWTVADVTEQRRAQSELEKSNARYDQLASHIPVGVFIYRTRLGLKHVIEYVSPKTCELIDVTESALLADSEAVYEAVHREDLPRFLELFNSATRSGEPLRWEGRFWVRGHIRWMRVEADPIPGCSDGESVWNGVLIDITELKEAEEKLKN